MATDFNMMIDPELRSTLQLMPPSDDLTVEEQRAGFDAMAAMWAAAVRHHPGIEVRDIDVPGPAGAPNIIVRLFRPRGSTTALPAVLWVHGGGFRIGNRSMDDGQNERIAADLNMVVASVEYRLAPETRYPGAVEDIYAALRWLQDNHGELGVDPDRIAIAGASAGGGLAAAVALMARDRGGPALKFQLLIYPCLDDSHSTPSSQVVADSRLWNRRKSIEAWDSYLGPDIADPVPVYAAPARSQNLSGLPPTFMLVADQDLLRDESIAYAQRLMQANVLTEMHVYPGTYHGFYNFVPDAAVSRRAVDDMIGALKRGLA